MRIVMMGTGTFAEPTFEALIGQFGTDVVGLVTQPERDSGNKRGSTRQTGKGMATIAQEHNIPIVQPESINTPDGLLQLDQLQPDLLVVAAYGQILSPAVLTRPSRGVINVHASLLPKYRGAAPVAYAILGGDATTGVTIIKVTPGLDSGDMVLQGSLAILPDDTTGSLEGRLAQLGSKLAVEVVRKYQAGGPVEGVKQDSSQVSKAPKIKKEFGLIDWTKPAVYISRLIRAMQPWPTAYSFLHRPGKEPMRVIISKSATSRTDGSLPRTDLPSGTVLAKESSGNAKEPRLGVVCAPGERIDILELQPAGKKRMTADEFLRGYPIVEGMRFGPDVRV